MPRRSGTTTVWSSTKTAATGAHMSPVSPKPCSMTTAGPLPPTRTWIVAPSALMFRFRKLGGNEPTFADDGTVSPPFERRRVTPRQVSVRTGRRHLRRWCQDGAGAAPGARSLCPRYLGALRAPTRQRLPGCVTVPRRLGLLGLMTVRLTWNLLKVLRTRNANDKPWRPSGNGADSSRLSTETEPRGRRSRWSKSM